MKDLYKHDPDGVMAVVTSLREKTNGYSNVVTRLNNLVSSINDSSAWIDVEIKTSFVNTCKSYIEIYNKLIAAMEVYATYLEKKSEVGAAIETAYSGG